MGDTGRPEYTDEQFQTWLDDMTPFLKLGNSLYHALDKASLIKHKDSVYRKFRLGDWFCEKIETYRRFPGEIVNSIFVQVIMAVDEKIRQGSQITSDEWRNLRFFAEKHKSCQQFFINRTETTQVEPNKIAEVIERLEIEKTDYDDVAKEAKKAMEAMLPNSSR
ncbi:MAG: hypothetical protein UX80_C0010G0018 [Candidatus Amesbacteria bacterium GW2011_GWA2_47_11b]|uniref:Uncharacterized protein n=1 Tax=Candidatus Amesbacteria bacterium GW2011_GWA2_47_11b TaxID=1618358 RepID=A0A0G1RKY9_9BACT|nr:MAG: hypothetical protein UX42_C0007G0023 [Microgenomates group bacterium GW2011_GWC1_46_20]KKU57757.1 MAG: hypothetical protein UX80_C0010G0018 [Candidatus Amesbacteria bacterium GW2011_GWA2_47_11b]